MKSKHVLRSESSKLPWLQTGKWHLAYKNLIWQNVCDSLTLFICFLPALRIALGSKAVSLKQPASSSAPMIIQYGGEPFMRVGSTWPITGFSLLIPHIWLWQMMLLREPVPSSRSFIAWLRGGKNRGPRIHTKAGAFWLSDTNWVSKKTESHLITVRSGRTRTFASKSRELLLPSLTCLNC